MKKIEISREQLNKSMKYHSLSKQDNFLFILTDLENELEKARKHTHRITNMEEMYRVNHTLNGYENCINYIKTQLDIYKKYNDGIISIKEVESNES